MLGIGLGLVILTLPKRARAGTAFQEGVADVGALPLVLQVKLVLVPWLVSSSQSPCCKSILRLLVVNQCFLAGRYHACCEVF